MDLSNVKRRGKLEAQREPHWQKIDAGQYLGFRSPAGTWIARWYDPDVRRNRFHALGEYGSLVPHERFSAALKDARAWFAHVSGGGSAGKAATVKEACEAYAKGRSEDAARFRRHVYGDPIAKVPLTKLTQKHVKGWRERLAAKPAPVAFRKDGKAKTKPRSASALNRDMTALRAALNQAFADGDVLTDHAWRVALKPVRNADRRRDVYLTREERRAILASLPDDAAAFVRGLCALPLRPGALAELRAGDFNPRTAELKIGKDKSGQDRKIKLPDETVALFKEQRKGKLPAAFLFVQADGKPWNRHAWRLPINEAVAAAGLSPKITAYAFRHSTITDLIVAGVPALTVAQLSGTSVAMIEKHYGHLLQGQATAALATLVL